MENQVLVLTIFIENVRALNCKRGIQGYGDIMKIIDFFVSALGTFALCFVDEKSLLETFLFNEKFLFVERILMCNRLVYTKF